MRPDLGLTAVAHRGQLKLNFEVIVSTINAKTLRAHLPAVVARVRKGARYTVLYRSRPAFRIVPIDDDGTPVGALTDDPLYQADAVGASGDGRTSADHDAVLYGR